MQSGLQQQQQQQPPNMMMQSGVMRPVLPTVGQFTSPQNAAGDTLQHLTRIQIVQMQQGRGVGGLGQQQTQQQPGIPGLHNALAHIMGQQQSAQPSPFVNTQQLPQQQQQKQQLGYEAGVVGNVNPVLYGQNNNSNTIMNNSNNNNTNNNVLNDKLQSFFSQTNPASLNASLMAQAQQQQQQQQQYQQQDAVLNNAIAQQTLAEASAIANSISNATGTNNAPNIFTAGTNAQAVNRRITEILAPTTAAMMNPTNNTTTISPNAININTNNNPMAYKRTINQMTPNGGMEAADDLMQQQLQRQNPALFQQQQLQDNEQIVQLKKWNLAFP